MSSQDVNHVSSPFVQPGRHASHESLAILHLRRDHLTPIHLSRHDDKREGYDEGKVTNTRFGSYPHSTLIGLPWGSQVRASKVDTGSRGRKTNGTKRKRHEADVPFDTTAPGVLTSSDLKTAVAAQTGFAHILPPTPETWTLSLPHRTQIVYTPDYSFILQRLKARPGGQIVEAGAGSGSFSHAAARAIYKGSALASDRSGGKVWSFEFHQRRSDKLQQEISEHGLSGIVNITHRDVYADGFSLSSHEGRQIVQADAVFLDLPAPWMALPHLKRKIDRPSGSSVAIDLDATYPSPQRWSQGPLREKSPIHICCFLPCIEQVQKTVSALQSHSWQHISVVEVMAQRIEVRRERVGINEEGLRGVNASPANVEEAILKLKEDENRTQMFHQIGQKVLQGGQKATISRGDVKTKQQRLRDIQAASERRKLYKEGRLIHRSEPELKSHTSYLVFAVLPVEWCDTGLGGSGSVSSEKERDFTQ